MCGVSAKKDEKMAVWGPWARGGHLFGILKIILDRWTRRDGWDECMYVKNDGEAPKECHPDALDPVEASNGVKLRLAASHARF